MCYHVCFRIYRAYFIYCCVSAPLSIQQAYEITRSNHFCQFWASEMDSENEVHPAWTPFFTIRLFMWLFGTCLNDLDQSGMPMHSQQWWTNSRSPEQYKLKDRRVHLNKNQKTRRKKNIHTRGNTYLYSYSELLCTRTRTRTENKNGHETDVDMRFCHVDDTNLHEKERRIQLE